MKLVQERVDIMNNTTYLYIRVSTDKQDYDRQLHVLNKAGFNESNSVIVTETYTGTRLDGREKLNNLINNLQEGDMIVIESLSRLARSLKDLLSLIEVFEQTGVTLKSIKEQIDMTSAMGRLMLSIMGAFNQFERDIISERTKEKLQSLKEQGVELGRPKKYDHQAIIDYYTSDKSITYNDVSEKFGISKGAISNIMNKYNVAR